MAAKAVEVDALVELGRYDEAVVAAAGAASACASTSRRSPGSRTCASSTATSTARSRRCARRARRRRSRPENTAYVTTLLGNLLVHAGKPDEARDAYEAALAIVPDHAAAIAGLGRLAVGRGDLAEAIGRFEKASAILPLPEYVIALGEAHEAAGDLRGGRARATTSPGPRRPLFEAAGVDVDLELALFEADHGDPATALGSRRQAYATRQTVRTADALAWAYHRAGRDDGGRAALRGGAPAREPRSALPAITPG